VVESQCFITHLEYVIYCILYYMYNLYCILWRVILTHPTLNKSVSSSASTPVAERHSYRSSRGIHSGTGPMPTAQKGTENGGLPGACGSVCVRVCACVCMCSMLPLFDKGRTLQGVASFIGLTRTAYLHRAYAGFLYQNVPCTHPKYIYGWPTLLVHHLLR
jgi:hypothetical protein